MIEIDCLGSKFTWRGPQVGDYERVFEKLDRCLCNGAWRVRFAKGVCKVLTRLSCSGYYPLSLLIDEVCLIEVLDLYILSKHGLLMKVLLNL